MSWKSLLKTVSWIMPLLIGLAVAWALGVDQTSCVAKVIRTLAFAKANWIGFLVIGLVLVAMIVRSRKVAVRDLHLALLNSFLFSGVIGAYIGFAIWNYRIGGGGDAAWFAVAAGVLYALFGGVATVIANHK